MSHNQSPVKIIVADSLYEILAQRHADRNARLAADGLPPATDDFPFITKQQAEQQAEAKRAAQNAPPTRGRLTHAARVKIAVRSESNPSFARHARKCAICRHPEIDSIEDWYINWTSAHWIAIKFQVGLEDVVYRHARAAGLDLARRQNSRTALEKLVERVDQVTVTSSAVIRAVRSLSLVDDNGHWTDPPSTHIVLTGKDLPNRNITSTACPAASPEQDEQPALSIDMSDSNRGNMKI